MAVSEGQTDTDRLLNLGTLMLLCFIQHNFLKLIEELFKNQDSNEDVFVPDAKQCPPPEQIISDKKDYEIIPTCEISSATLDPDVDIRPRIWDAEAKSWTLLDTGSQASVLKPNQSDKVDPSILLETVNGQGMKCYGKRSHSIRINRNSVNKI